MKGGPRLDTGEIGRSFAKAVSEENAIATLRGYSYKTSVGRLRKLERLYLDQLKGNERLRREIRRRVAQRILYKAISCHRPLRVCRSRLKELEDLGFTNIEIRGDCYLVYARAAIDHGNPQLACQVGSDMATRLRRSLKRRKSPLSREILELFENLLRDLRTH